MQKYKVSQNYDYIITVPEYRFVTLETIIEARDERELRHLAEIKLDEMMNKYSDSDGVITDWIHTQSHTGYRFHPTIEELPEPSEASKMEQLGAPTLFVLTGVE